MYSWQRRCTLILEAGSEQLAYWLERHLEQKRLVRFGTDGKRYELKLWPHARDDGVLVDAWGLGSNLWCPDLFRFTILPLSDNRTELVAECCDEQWLFDFVKELCELPRRWPETESQVLAYIERLCSAYQDLPPDPESTEGVSREAQLLWEALWELPTAELVMLKYFPQLADEFCLNSYFRLHPGSDVLSDDEDMTSVYTKGWKYWATRAGLPWEPGHAEEDGADDAASGEAPSEVPAEAGPGEGTERGDSPRRGAPRMEERPDWEQKCEKVRRFRQLRAKGYTAQAAAASVELPYDTVLDISNRMAELGLQ